MNRREFIGSVVLAVGSIAGGYVVGTSDGCVSNTGLRRRKSSLLVNEFEAQSENVEKQIAWLGGSWSREVMSKQVGVCFGGEREEDSSNLWVAEVSGFDIGRIGMSSWGEGWSEAEERRSELVKKMWREALTVGVLSMWQGWELDVDDDGAKQKVLGWVGEGFGDLEIDLGRLCLEDVDMSVFSFVEEDLGGKRIASGGWIMVGFPGLEWGVDNVSVLMWPDGRMELTKGAMSEEKILNFGGLINELIVANSGELLEPYRERLGA